MPTVIMSEKDGAQPTNPSQHQNPDTLALPAHIGTTNQRIGLDSTTAAVGQLNTAQQLPSKRKPGRQHGKSNKWQSHQTIDRSNRRRSCATTSTPILTPPPSTKRQAQSLPAPAVSDQRPPPENSLFLPITATLNHALTVQQSNTAAVLTPPIRAPSEKRPTTSLPPAALGSSQSTTTSTRGKRQRLCNGVYNGNFGPALNLAGKMMLRTGQQLIKMAMEPDLGIASFAALSLAKSHGMFLPYYGMAMKRSENAKDGFTFFSNECTCVAKPGRYQNCPACSTNKRKLKNYVNDLYTPNVKRPGHTLPIESTCRNYSNILY